MDQLERLVRRGSQETFQMEREREIRQKWIRAGRFALNSISKRHSLTKQPNIFTISENPKSPNMECTKNNNEYGNDGNLGYFSDVFDDVLEVDTIVCCRNPTTP